MAYLKPQTPIQLNENYIYPLTTADQVITTTGERLNSLFKKTIKETATLQVANWSDTLPYIQTITISESTDDYNVDANIVYSGNKADTELNKAASCLTYVKKSGKNIIFYCLKEKPEIDIPIEITGTCRNTIATVEEGIKLNFDIIGNPRPKTGDTLYWDGNTEGLEVYDFGNNYTFYKVSDVVPTLDDFSKGATAYFTRLGYEMYIEPEYIKYFNNDIWVQEGAIIVDNENASVSKGTYFLAYDSYYLSYLTIPGFTGFEKDDIEVKENTIWVDTDVPITGYKFSATEPEDMVEGEVWIKTGDDSDVAFDIVEGAKMYPLYVKQYVNGAWVNKIAMSYQKGEWISIEKTLFPPIDGWSTTKISSDKTLGTGTFDVGVFVGKITATGQGIGITKQAIDFTNIRCVDVYFSESGFNQDSGDGGGVIALITDNEYLIGSNEILSKWASDAECTEGVMRIDVSGVTGTHRFIVGIISWASASGATGSITVHKIVEVA